MTAWARCAESWSSPARVATARRRWGARSPSGWGCRSSSSTRSSTAPTGPRRPTTCSAAQLAPVLASDGWVIDGVYRRKLGNLVLEAADVVVWLDLPIRVWLPRLVRRTGRRLVGREEIWNGNRESLRTAVWGRDSLFGYALRSHFARRREWPAAAERLSRWSGCAPPPGCGRSSPARRRRGCERAVNTRSSHSAIAPVADVGVDLVRGRVGEVGVEHAGVRAGVQTAAADRGDRRAGVAAAGVPRPACTPGRCG